VVNPCDQNFYFAPQDSSVVRGTDPYPVSVAMGHYPVPATKGDRPTESLPQRSSTLWIPAERSAGATLVDGADNALAIRRDAELVDIGMKLREFLVN
jgi:hypothetical protein